MPTCSKLYIYFFFLIIVFLRPTKQSIFPCNPLFVILGGPHHKCSDNHTSGIACSYNIRQVGTQENRALELIDVQPSNLLFISRFGGFWTNTLWLKSH